MLSPFLARASPARRERPAACSAAVGSHRASRFVRPPLAAAQPTDPSAERAPLPVSSSGACTPRPSTRSPVRILGSPLGRSSDRTPAGSLGCPFSSSPVHTFIRSAVSPFGRSSVRSPASSLACPFSRSPVHTFVHSAVSPFGRPSVRSPASLLAGPLPRPPVRPFSRLAASPFVHSAIRPPARLCAGLSARVPLPATYSPGEPESRRPETPHGGLWREGEFMPNPACARSGGILATRVNSIPTRPATDLATCPWMAEGKGERSYPALLLSFLPSNYTNAFALLLLAHSIYRTSSPAATAHLYSAGSLSHQTIAHAPRYLSADNLHYHTTLPPSRLFACSPAMCLPARLPA